MYYAQLAEQYPSIANLRGRMSDVNDWPDSRRQEEQRFIRDYDTWGAMVSLFDSGGRNLDLILSGKIRHMPLSRAYAYEY